MNRSKFVFRTISILLVLFCSIGATLSFEGQIKHKFDVKIPMRDGTILSADVWMPLEPGRYPAILVRTPYLKTWEYVRFPEFGKFFASRGYVYVVQDVRGRGDSEGKFDFFFPDGKDGYDSVEWIAAQPWSNGKVGMMGVSYLGTVQWLAARERPPHLVCIAPTAAGGCWFNEVPYRGGAFKMSWALDWINNTSGRISQHPNTEGIDWQTIFQHRPLITMDEFMGRCMQLYRDFLQHPTLDDYWRRITFTPEDFRKIDLPALHVTGWFDRIQLGALSYWKGMVEHSQAKEKQYLLIGPWDHEQTFFGGALRIGEIEFSGDSVIDMRPIHLAFFDYYLKGSAPGFDSPRARIYITGSNQWKELDRYPPVQTKHRRLFLHSGGKANTLIGDGRLSWEAPQNEPPDRFTYNPKNPVPAKGLAEDHQEVEHRDDVLVYTSDVLKDPLELIGRVSVTLYGASDAMDTDFTANILDVYPDRRAVKLGAYPAGVIRARYRDGYDRIELLSPNKPEKYTIELFEIGHMFLPGHRIRLEISSSVFPYVNPNQNTGNPVATDTEWKIAHQTVYHDIKRPSHVYLPVIPKIE